MIHKLFSLVSFLPVFLIVFSSSAQALVASPTAGNYAKGEEITISLTANPANEYINAIEFNLLAENLQILDYTLPAESGNWLVSKPGCENDQFHTADKVCVTLGKQQAIQPGESLGTLRVMITDDGNARLLTINGSGYSDGEAIYELDQQLLSWNEDVSESSTGFPADLPWESILIVVCIGLTVGVLLLLLLLRKSKRAVLSTVLIVGGGLLLAVAAIVVLNFTQSTTPEQSSASQNSNRHSLKVMFIGYNPVDGDRDIATTYFPSAMAGRTAAQFEDEMFETIRNAYLELSEGRINFSLKKKLNITSFPTYDGVQEFTFENYARCIYGTPAFQPEFCDALKVRFDYVKFVQDNNLCQIAKDEDIDEIWMFSPPYMLAWENFMFGPTVGFPVNGPGFVVPGCDRHVVVTNGTYDRPGNLMHIIGHKAEAIMGRLVSYWKAEDKELHWNRFSKIDLYGGMTPDFSVPYCGNIHYPHNGTFSYDIANKTTRPSACSDWKNFPEYTGNNVQSNCDDWGCTDDGWSLKWLSSLPHSVGEVLMTAPSGEKFVFKKDWWYYFLYPENVISFPQYIQECTSFTYGEWSVCSNKTQTRSVVSRSPENCYGEPAEPLVQECADPIVACTDYKYSDWGICIDGKQSRTVEDSLPSGCIGGANPVLSQSCQVACTAFTYTEWSGCNEESLISTRQLVSSLPTGCVGGTPEPLSQSCTIAPERCTEFNYSNWSACVEGKQTRTLVSQLPGGCSGSAPGPFEQSCQSVCSEFTYSDWGECIDGSQNRTILSSLPSGCSGGTPAELTRACTPVCSNFVYSEWSECVNSNQTRTIISALPQNCSGGSPAALSRSCTAIIQPTLIPQPVACTSHTYSPWGACRGGSSTRTVVSSVPEACVGGVAPVTTQSCTSPQVTCQEFSYSAWSNCEDGRRERIIVGSSPAGCIGGTPAQLSQGCTSEVTCQSFTYSDWGQCRNGIQYRNISGSTPTSCSGGNPQLSRSCETQPLPSVNVTPVVAGSSCVAIDGNQDGRITLIELARFLRNFGTKCEPVNVQGCGSIDANGDGIVDDKDLRLVLSNYNKNQCRI